MKLIKRKAIYQYSEVYIDDSGCLEVVIECTPEEIRDIKAEVKSQDQKDHFHLRECPTLEEAFDLAKLMYVCEYGPGEKFTLEPSFRIGRKYITFHQWYGMDV